MPIIIRNVRMIDCKQGGAYFGPGFAVDADGLHVEHTDGHGVTIDGATGQVSNVTTHHVGGYGMYVTDNDHIEFEKAISAKPEAEQARLRQFVTDFLAGSLAGVTVEVVKKQLGIF